MSNALEAVNDAQAVMDERPPPNVAGESAPVVTLAVAVVVARLVLTARGMHAGKKGGVDLRFENRKEIELRSAVAVATPLVLKAEERVEEAGHIALQVHAGPLIALGRSLSRMCRHGTLAMVLALSAPVPGTLKAIHSAVVNCRQVYRELVGDVIAGEACAAPPCCTAAACAHCPLRCSLDRHSRSRDRGRSTSRFTTPA